MTIHEEITKGAYTFEVYFQVDGGAVVARCLTKHAGNIRCKGRRVVARYPAGTDRNEVLTWVRNDAPVPRT